MNTILHTWQFGVFLVIAVFHVYWAFGGKSGVKNAIPENSDGPLFRPEIGGTLLIALIFFAGAALVTLDYFQIELIFLQRYLHHVIIFVFTARAIGEFKYVGFFKRVKDSSFARYDTRLYSPLCLSIAGASLGILVL